METQKREQIIKLLNLDSMINEYLAEPVKKKKPNTYKSSKNNNQRDKYGIRGTHHSTL